MGGLPVRRCVLPDAHRHGRRCLRTGLFQSPYRQRNRRVQQWQQRCPVGSADSGRHRRGSKNHGISAPTSAIVCRTQDTCQRCGQGRQSVGAGRSCHRRASRMPKCRDIDLRQSALSSLNVREGRRENYAADHATQDPPYSLEYLPSPFISKSVLVR
jgi:hypothetical protein